MTALNDYLQLLQNGAYASFIAAGISVLNLFILMGMRRGGSRGGDAMFGKPPKDES